MFGAPRQRKRCEILHGLNAPCKACSALQAIETGAPQAGEWIASNGCTYMADDNLFIDNDGTQRTLEIGAHDCCPGGSTEIQQIQSTPALPSISFGAILKIVDG